jgi:hypothetical protein
VIIEDLDDLEEYDDVSILDLDEDNISWMSKDISDEDQHFIDNASEAGEEDYYTDNESWAIIKEIVMIKIWHHLKKCQNQLQSQLMSMPPKRLNYTTQEHCDTSPLSGNVSLLITLSPHILLLQPIRGSFML